MPAPPPRMPTTVWPSRHAVVGDRARSHHGAGRRRRTAGRAWEPAPAVVAHAHGARVSTRPGPAAGPGSRVRSRCGRCRPTRSRPRCRVSTGRRHPPGGRPHPGCTQHRQPLSRAGSGMAGPEDGPPERPPARSRPCSSPRKPGSSCCRRIAWSCRFSEPTEEERVLSTSWTQRHRGWATARALSTPSRIVPAPADGLGKIMRGVEVGTARRYCSLPDRTARCTCSWREPRRGTGAIAGVVRNRRRGRTPRRPRRLYRSCADAVRRPTTMINRGPPYYGRGVRI